MLNLNFEISNLLFATQAALSKARCGGPNVTGSLHGYCTLARTNLSNFQIRDCAKIAWRAHVEVPKFWHGSFPHPKYSSILLDSILWCQWYAASACADLPGPGTADEKSRKWPILYEYHPVGGRRGDILRSRQLEFLSMVCNSLHERKNFLGV